MSLWGNGRIELNAVAGIQNFLSFPDKKLDLAGQDEKDLLSFMVAHDPAALSGLRGSIASRSRFPKA